MPVNSRSPSAASGLHLQLGGGLVGPAVAAATSSLPLQGSLPGALPSVLGTTLPLAPSLPGAAASLTNGTSEAAAQAAMFAALQSAQQQGAAAALPNGALNTAATPYLITAPQQHPLSGVTSQAQNVYPAHRLFDPGVTAVIQQMQSVSFLDIL